MGVLSLMQLNCRRTTAFSVTCSVKCVITSTVDELYMGVCVITYELNCQRVTAFSVTCSVKCVITSTVYGCVITYELNCRRTTAFSVTCSVKCVITSTVDELYIIWVCYHL